MNQRTKQAVRFVALIGLLLSNVPVLAQPAAGPLHHKGIIHAVAFSPDGTKLASAGEDGIVRLWDLATGKQLYRWAGHEGAVLSLAYHPRGTMVVSGGNDCKICMWDPATGKPFHVFKPHKGPVFGLSFSGDKEYAFFASCSNRVRVRQGTLGLLWHSFQKETPGAIKSVSFSSSGTRVATAAEDGTVLLWHLLPDEKSIVRPGITDHVDLHPGGAEHVAFSPDEKLLASGGPEVFILTETRGGDQVHSEKVRVYSNFVFAQKANVLIASFGESARDGTGVLLPTPHVASVWSLATKKVVSKLPAASAASAIALSPDERILATASRDRIRLWDWTTGAEVFPWKK